MADKKCPKCGIWNSETAEICDCGFTFVIKGTGIGDAEASNKVSFSPAKNEYFGKLFRDNGITAENITIIHKSIIWRVGISIVTFIASILLSAILRPISFIMGMVDIGLIIINLYDRNGYFRQMLNRIWKYPAIGMLLGWLTNCVGLTIFTDFLQGPSDAITVAYPIGSLTLTMIFGLLGLYIGRRRVIDEAMKYIVIQ